MAELKQTAQAKILMSQILIQKAGPPNRQTWLPPNSSFLYESKRRPFGRPHRFDYVSHPSPSPYS